MHSERAAVEKTSHAVTNDKHRQLSISLSSVSGAIEPSGTGSTRATGVMPFVRGPSLSSQKYKSFHYSRVASVAEEDVRDASPDEMSTISELRNSLIENEDRASRETLIAKSSGRQDVATSSSYAFTMIDENSTLGSDTTLNAEQTRSNRGSVPPRQHRLALVPPSLHMSFDVDNSLWVRQQEILHGEKPLSKSSDSVTPRVFPGAITKEDIQQLLAGTRGSSSPSTSRVLSDRTGKGQKHHTQSFEIAQIGAEYMRTSGAIGQFRGVLCAPQDKNSILRLNFTKKQNSKERDRFRKRESASSTGKRNSFSTTALASLISAQSVPKKDHSDLGTVGLVDSIDDEHKSNGPRLTRTISFENDEISTNLPSENKNKVTPLDSQQSVDHSKHYRLQYHRSLFGQRMRACDYSFAVAILGILLMILETEFTAAGIYTKDSSYSYALKFFIVASTLVLLALIIAYHVSDIKLFMLDYGCDDLRIAVRKRRICLIIVELIICGICPFPGDFRIACQSLISSPMDSKSQTPYQSSNIPCVRVPVDIILSVPMFLRMYLICRLMLLHSKLFTDGPSRSISALNRVNITARLVLKMLMTVSPVTVLLAFTASFWLTAAWVMLVCERYNIQSHPQPQSGYDFDLRRHQSIIDYDSSWQSYLNSIWLVAVTALTVGYGDIVPNTYCGRAVSIICGIVGAGTSSLVVAVVAKKLEFSRAEKHVHNFMMDSVITKKMKNAAANVLRETWLIYKNRKLVQKVDAAKIRYHQRKFLLAIHELRRTKRGKRKLDENFITVQDMAKTTSMMYEIIADMRLRQQEMEQKVSDTEKRCVNIEAYISQLQVSLCSLPDLVARKLRPPSPLRQ